MLIHEDIRFQELIERMEALYIENRTEEMLLLIEELQTLAETEQDDIGLAASYFYRDILSEESPDSPTYMQYAKRSLQISETKNIPYYQMKASNTLGILYSEISDFHTSLEYYLYAMRIADEHPEYNYVGIVLNNIGNLFVWLKDYVNATVYLERAYYKSIVQNHGDSAIIDIIILNLIELYTYLDNDEKVSEWDALRENIVEAEVKELIVCIILIHEARKLAKIDEAIIKIKNFIEVSHELKDYIYIFHCSVSALRLALEMKAFDVATSAMELITQIQKKSSVTSFAYDYALAKMEYYQAMPEHLKFEDNSVYKDYFVQTQFRINQLNNTYAQSLSVKIALEDIKDENKNVRLQNNMLQKNIELDIFTNLYNKVSTEKYVKLAMEERPAHIKQGLLLIDIDLFKRINDNYGHVFGDHVITVVAEILSEIDVDQKIAGRFGGDEFLVFLKNQNCVAEIKAIAELLLQKVKNGVKLPDERVKEITLSIGICVIDSDISFSEAFVLADEALYLAKERGRNQYVLSAELGKQ